MGRPISPFLSVYKPEITSLFSIGERITGLLLVVIFYLVIILLKLKTMFLSYYWFYSICYLIFKGAVSGFFIGGLLIFAIFSTIYHIIFGVRYLYWDRVYGKLGINTINKYTPELLGITVILSIIIWLY